MIRFVIGPDRTVRSRPRRKAARAGNLVERAGGCDRNRLHPRCLRQGGSRAGGGSPRSAGLVCRRRWRAGWSIISAWPGARDRRSPASPRRGSGWLPAGRRWWCRPRTAARRSGSASSAAGTGRWWRRWTASGWARCSAATAPCTWRWRRAVWRRRCGTRRRVWRGWPTRVDGAASRRGAARGGAGRTPTGAAERIQPPGVAGRNDVQDAGG